MKPLNLTRILNKPLLLTVILIGCTFYAKAQTAPKTDAAKTTTATAAPKGATSYIDTFFKKYKTNTDSAVDYIFGTNKLFAGNISQINLLKTKLDSLRSAIGKYLGKDLIIQRSASPSLVIYSYLVKHENQPVRFTFIFYKAQNDWALYRFYYDDQMDTELIEAAKINNKKFN